MTKLNGLAMAVAAMAGAALLPATPALSAPPTTIPEVISLCAPIIAEEYQGKTDRWLECVRGTQDFVNFVIGPPTQAEDTGQVAADLVFALTQLYQDGAACEEHETELPEAIAVALAFEMDETRRELIQSISDSVKACETLETASISQGAPVSLN